jgi:hypothetical protein
VTKVSSQPDFLAAIATGAPPFERLRHPAFEPDGRRGPDRELVSTWIEEVTGGNAGLEDAFWRGSRLDPETGATAFRPARVRAGPPLPLWATCLGDALDALPSSHRERDAETAPTAVVGHAWRDAARVLLGWEDLRARHAFLTEEALASLTTQLATRVLLAAWSVLELESLTQFDPVWDMGRDAWLERLAGFSGLTFTVGTALRQWRQSSIEMIERLARDQPLLKEAWGPAAPGGPLTRIEGDQGDRHDDGRAVATLTFANGGRVVYKPKDLRSASKFLDLAAFLNSMGATCPLPTRALITRGKYAWEEFIHEWQATTLDESARYFHRFGMYLRLLQLVEARDFWIDNIRIAGDTPVFTDLECILHPRLPAASAVDVAGLDLAVYEESVLPTAAVTQTIEVAGAGPQDFGALAVPGRRQLPVGILHGYSDRTNDAFELLDGKLYWQPKIPWPRTPHGPAEPADHLDDLERGFEEMQQLITRGARRLTALSGPLEGVSEAPVRVLMRDTWGYLVLLRVSLAPPAVLDGNAREVALAKVVQTAPDWFSGARPEDRVAIANAEVQALRLLDVPQFHTTAGGSDLVLSHELELEDVFESSGAERLRRRLREAEDFDVSLHLGILRATLEGMSHAPARAATSERTDA